MTLPRPSPGPVLLPEQQIDSMPWQPLPGSDGARIKQVCTGPGWAAGLLQLAPYAVETAHVHPDGEHHLWVLSGTVSSESTHLGVGSYVHIPAGLQHQLQDEGNGCTLYYVYVETARA
jgi:mannose-6-phosphate isomerase-like protein (cupin superfamily)